MFTMDMNNCKTLVGDMRSVGLLMRDEMNRLIHKDHKQFLVACIISKKELENGTFHSVLTSAEHQFHCLLNGYVVVSKRYFLFDRFIFLMNYKDHLGKDQHTEARLLDPFGKVLKRLKEENHQESKDDGMLGVSDSVFLSCLKKDFVRKFGEEESYYIAMFSHFLPCAQTDHMCAKLIRTFADLTKTNIIISYEMPYMTTDEQSCFESLEHEKITLIHPKDCQYFASKDDGNSNRHFQHDRMRPYHNYRSVPYTVQTFHNSLPFSGYHGYNNPAVLPFPYYIPRFYQHSYRPYS